MMICVFLFLHTFYKVLFIRLSYFVGQVQLRIKTKHINILIYSKMLNLVMKKLNRKLLYSTIYGFSLQNDLFNSARTPEQQINDFKVSSFFKENSQSHTSSQPFQTRVFNHMINKNHQVYPSENLAQFVDQTQQSLENKFHLHPHSQDQSSVLKSFCRQEFDRSVSASTKKQNTVRLIENISNLLKDNDKRQLATVLKEFTNSEKYRKYEKETPVEEKKLFKKVYSIFLKGIKDIGIARSLLKLFSESNPKLIEFKKFKPSNMTNSWMTEFDNQKINHKLMIQASLKPFEAQKPERSDPKKTQQKHKQKNQTLDLLEILESKTAKAKTKPIKLYLKKQFEVERLKIDKESLEQVEKKLFGNKKIVTEHIILKRNQISRPNQKQNQFGQNWVYAYDLPYEFDKNKAMEIVNMLSQKYGPIVEFRGESFKNFVEKSYTGTIVHLPQNFKEDSQRNRVKLETEYVLEVNQNKKKMKEKSKTIKMMEKCQIEKDLCLNRSTMVFKFKNKQDKTKFLSHEMRLYGLCFANLKNIRFEEAQSKSVVALSMIPWACQSAHLIKFINDALISLKISVTHPNCIIANGYVFLELANFYEALHAKDLLNNLIFQEHRIKAQLCYGSSYLFEGQYKYNFEQDHYEKLLQKLTQGRDKYVNKLLN